MFILQMRNHTHTHPRLSRSRYHFCHDALEWLLACPFFPMQSHYTHLHAGYLIHFSICIASRFVHFSFFLTEVTTSIYVAFLIISLCSFVITYSRSLSRIRQFAVSLPSFSVYCGRTLTCLHNILFQSYPPAHRRS